MKLFAIKIAIMQKNLKFSKLKLLSRDVPRKKKIIPAARGVDRLFEVKLVDLRV